MPRQSFMTQIPTHTHGGIPCDHHVSPSTTPQSSVAAPGRARRSVCVGGAPAGGCGHVEVTLVQGVPPVDGA
jgi:hypothetical protein